VMIGDDAKDFTTGLDEPKGIAFTGKYLVTTDLKRVWRIDSRGAKTLLADEKAFPHPVKFLNDTAVEPGGQAVYVTDMGENTKMRDPDGTLWPLASPQAKELPAVGRVYRITMAGKVTVAVDIAAKMPCPNGVSAPAKKRLLIGEFFNGTIFEANGKKLTALTTGLRGADGIEQDRRGNIYVSSWTQGIVWKMDRRGKKQTVVMDGFQSAADFFLDEKGRQLVVPDMKAGTITFVPLR
jgi:sugar lactone lactonase YvrE